MYSCQLWSYLLSMEIRTLQSKEGYSTKRSKTMVERTCLAVVGICDGTKRPTKNPNVAFPDERKSAMFDVAEYVPQPGSSWWKTALQRFPIEIVLSFIQLIFSTD